MAFLGYWGSIGIMEENMETTIRGIQGIYLGYIGCRV